VGWGGLIYWVRAGSGGAKQAAAHGARWFPSKPGVLLSVQTPPSGSAHLTLTAVCHPRLAGFFFCTGPSARSCLFAASPYPVTGRFEGFLETLSSDAGPSSPEHMVALQRYPIPRPLPSLPHPLHPSTRVQSTGERPIDPAGPGPELCST